MRGPHAVAAGMRAAHVVVLVAVAAGVGGCLSSFIPSITRPRGRRGPAGGADDLGRRRTGATLRGYGAAGCGLVGSGEVTRQ